MDPRFITANEQVKDLQNKVALASGPIIYCLESTDNTRLDSLTIDTKTRLQLTHQPDMLNGVNTISGTAIDSHSRQVPFTAIPYYAVGNRGKEGYKVWIPKRD